MIDINFSNETLQVQSYLKIHQCRFGNLIILFEICAHEICEKFVYKPSETIEYVKN